MPCSPCSPSSPPPGASAQFTTPSDEGGLGAVFISGLCGLATLLLLAGTVYFSLALIKGLRDLTLPMQRLSGYIERKYTGMGRTGGFWIVVQPGERPALAPTPRLATALTPPAAQGRRRPPRRPPAPAAERPPCPLETASAQRSKRPPATPAPPPPPAPEPEPIQHIHNPNPNPTARIFRVDKAVYNALRDAEPVVVGYSRFLEHVYYVEHTEAGDPVQLRNTSLI